MLPPQLLILCHIISIKNSFLLPRYYVGVLHKFSVHIKSILQGFSSNMYLGPAFVPALTTHLRIGIEYCIT